MVAFYPSINSFWGWLLLLDVPVDQHCKLRREPLTHLFLRTNFLTSLSNLCHVYIIQGCIWCYLLNLLLFTYFSRMFIILVNGINNIIVFKTIRVGKKYNIFEFWSVVICEPQWFLKFYVDVRFIVA